MALKDLVAQKSALTESAIEGIISDYVRYDPDEKMIAFTPGAGQLQNRAKVLVYLVALQGWPFVSEDLVATDVKPGELSEHIGIQGGTLRPILKELKDRHVIGERGGRYFVRPVALSAIKTELGGVHPRTETQRTHRPKSKTVKGISSSSSPKPDAKGNLRRIPNKKTGNVLVRFNKWIDDGFFDELKTLADVQRQFHREGLILPRTSVPQYLLKAVRAGRLTREETQVNKRHVWAYRSPK